MPDGNSISAHPSQEMRILAGHTLDVEELEQRLELAALLVQTTCFTDLCLLDICHAHCCTIDSCYLNSDQPSKNI